MANRMTARFFVDIAGEVINRDANETFSDEIETALKDVQDNAEQFNTCEKLLGAIGKVFDTFQATMSEGWWDKLWEAIVVALFYSKFKQINVLKFVKDAFGKLWA